MHIIAYDIISRIIQQIVINISDIGGLIAEFLEKQKRSEILGGRALARRSVDYMDKKFSTRKRQL